MSKNSNLSSDKIEDCDNSSWQVSTDDKEVVIYTLKYLSKYLV